jgi:hypothetical protein
MHMHTNTQTDTHVLHMHHNLKQHKRENSRDIVSTEVAIQGIVAFSLCLARWTTECTVHNWSHRKDSYGSIPHLPWYPTISLQRTSLQSNSSVHMNIGECALDWLKDGRGS